MALSLQLHEGPGFFLAMQVEDLNDYAEMVKAVWEEAAKHRGKK